MIEWFSKGKRGRKINHNYIVVHDRGYIVAHAGLGEHLEETISIGFDAKQDTLHLKNGGIFKVTPNGRTATNSKKFRCCGLSKTLKFLNYQFPVRFDMAQDGDGWSGKVIEEDKQ